MLDREKILNSITNMEAIAHQLLGEAAKIKRQLVDLDTQKRKENSTNTKTQNVLLRRRKHVLKKTTKT